MFFIPGKPLLRSLVLLPFSFFIVIFAVQEKAAAQLTDAQIVRKLQDEISPQEGEVVFFLADGSRIKGVRLEEGGDYIKIKQVFGYSGSTISRIEKRQILKIEPVAAQELQITAQELQIKKELPGFHFSRNGVYSFFTDQDYFKITKSVELLQRLYGAFLAAFSPLIEDDLKRSIDVVIFGTSGGYNAYKRKIAPYLQNAAGFYDVNNNQLVFYDFFNSPDYTQIDEAVKQERKRIEGLKQQNEKYKDSDQDVYKDNQKRIHDYELSLSAYMIRIAAQARDANIRVLRHEASHQLTFDLMLNGSAENIDSWVLEGLAEFSSTPSMGEKNSDYLKICRDALKSNRLIPLAELYSYSLNNRFYTLQEDILELAYAQSWALFYFLMQPQWRDKFFQYWKDLRKSGAITTLQERLKFVEDSLGVPLEELQKQFYVFISAP